MLVTCAVQRGYALKTDSIWSSFSAALGGYPLSSINQVSAVHALYIVHSKLTSEIGVVQLVAMSGGWDNIMIQGSWYVFIIFV